MLVLDGGIVCIEAAADPVSGGAAVSPVRCTRTAAVLSATRSRCGYGGWGGGAGVGATTRDITLQDISGKSVAVAETKPYGCSVKYAK